MTGVTLINVREEPPNSAGRTVNPETIMFLEHLNTVTVEDGWFKVAEGDPKKLDKLRAVVKRASNNGRGLARPTKVAVRNGKGPVAAMYAKAA